MRVLVLNKHICCFLIALHAVFCAAACTKQDGALQEFEKQKAQTEAEELMLVTRAVHKELKKTNTPDVESFKVEFYHCYAASFGKTILVPPEAVTVIVNRKKDRQKYREFQAAIDHEKTHVLENHLQKRGLFVAGNCVLMTLLTKGKLPTNQLELLVDSTTMLFCRVLFRAVMREQERVADLGVRPDPLILQAKGDFFAKMAFDEGSTHFLLSMFRTHPPFQERADSFRARAALLRVNSSSN